MPRSPKSTVDPIIGFENVINQPEIVAWFAKQSDWKAAWNKAQLWAAVRLVHHFFGVDWYQLVLNKIDDPTFLTDRRYLRYAKRAVRHPLAEIFWNGGAEELIRIVRLGEALKVLGFGNADLQAKLDELRSDSFANAYFELKTALIYSRNGFEVKFLRPARGAPCPDIRIAKDGIVSFVECKKRRPVTAASSETKVGGVIDRLRDARRQIAAVSKHGIVYIELEDNLDYSEPILQRYTQAINEALPDLPDACCVVLTWEKILERAETVHLVTQARGIANPKTACPFPRDVWCNPRALAPLTPPSIIDLQNTAPALLNS